MNSLIRSGAVARAVALVLLLTLIAVVGTVLWSLHRWHQERSAHLVELVELQSRLSARPATSAVTAKTEVNLDAFRLAFLQGGDEAVVGADLQSRLRALVTGKGCELSSVRVLPPRSVGDQRLLGLRVQLRGPLKGIRDVLQLIEGGKPFLFVDRAILRLEEQRGAVRETSEEALTGMHAELDIYGALWADFSNGPKEARR